MLRENIYAKIKTGLLLLPLCLHFGVTIRFDIQFHTANNHFVLQIHLFCFAIGSVGSDLLCVQVRSYIFEFLSCSMKCHFPLVLASDLLFHIFWRFPRPSILIHQPHRIVGTIHVRTHSRVLVRQRVHREPEGEAGVVVPCRGRGRQSGAGSGKVVGHGWDCFAGAKIMKFIF